MRSVMEPSGYIEMGRDEVAKRARRLWKAAGRPNGRDLEYWLQAEVELLAARNGGSSPKRGRMGSRGKLSSV